MPQLKPDLKPKLLKMISQMEGGGRAAGNFDGQLLSYGPLQWNIGQGTLTPIFRHMVKLNRAGFAAIMGEAFTKAVEGETLASFIKAQILDGAGRVKPAWFNCLEALRKTPYAGTAFEVGAKKYLDSAQKLTETLGFTTERGFALCFDVAVQNGAPRADHINPYRTALAQNEKAGVDVSQEWQKLKMLSHVVSGAANPRWAADVLSRKLSISLGGTEQSGLLVHKGSFDLEKDFGIVYGRSWY